MNVSIACFVLLLSTAAARVVDFEKDALAVPDDASLSTAWDNGRIMNATLNRLMPGDVFLIPNKSFHLMGGIQAFGLKDVTFQLDGTLVFSNNMKEWPRDAKGHVYECLHFINLHNVTFTSSGKGTLDGQGAVWWGFPLIGYLLHQENRPRLMVVDDSSQILVENLFFKDSPYWTFLTRKIDGLEVRHCDVDVRRDQKDKHTLYDMTAFNTDGFDVEGRNIWIHDCRVWNQDDSFCVKDNTENVLIERVEASGIGLVIGSIASNVRNITFRNSHMHRPVNGIYMKFRGAGSISDVLYENILVDEPERWGIWIGPAQQAEGGKKANGTSHIINPCTAGGGCSLCWPMVPFTKCHGTAQGFYSNITLRNITVNNPKYSPGVLMADPGSPMVDVVFDSVKVNNPGKNSWGRNYKCENVQSGVAIGDTSPVPPCFQDHTASAVVV